MSILVVEVTAEGIIFGADRNVTTTYIKSGYSHQEVKTEKVLSWPNGKAIIGYVGQARINNIPTCEWLKQFIDKNLEFYSLKKMAEKLKEEVETQMRIDEGEDPAVGLIIHLGGFAEKDNIFIPEIYLITNIHGMTNGNYDCPDKNFGCSEEFGGKWIGVAPKYIRATLKLKAEQFDPFWFHQGFDLPTFNVLEKSIKGAFKYLCTELPKHKVPESVFEWEKHVRMQVLMYGAYFEAFHPLGEHYVGGGVDVVSLNWPENKNV